MRKKTALRTPQQRETSVREPGGLIDRGENAQDSATAKSALTNRSHRTWNLTDPSSLRTEVHPRYLARRPALVATWFWRCANQDAPLSFFSKFACCEFAVSVSATRFPCSFAL